jgi:hypothetical protein
MPRLRKVTAPILLIPVAVVLSALFRVPGLLLALGLCGVTMAARVAGRYERLPPGDGDGDRGPIAGSADER